MVFFALLILASSVTAAAQDRDAAFRLEQAGDTEQAAAVCLDWLQQNPGAGEYASVLIRCAALTGSAAAALTMMEEHIDRVPAGDRRDVYARMASLEVLTGLPERAVSHFQAASRQLESLGLLFRMGEFSKVRQASLEIVSRSGDPAIRDEAAALAALSLLYQNGSGNAEQALEEIRTYAQRHAPPASPLLLKAELEITLAAGEDPRNVTERLEEDFPSSAVFYLASSRILPLESPLSFLHPQPQDQAVLAGVFSRRSDAAAMRNRLENDAFTSWIEQDGESWKTMVNDADGHVTARLRAAGYSF